MVALGGSVSLGHGWIPKESIWPNRIASVLNEKVLSGTGVEADMYIGAVPAVGSDYFGKCWVNHLGLSKSPFSSNSSTSSSSTHQSQSEADEEEDYQITDISIFLLELSINDLYTPSSDSSSISAAESFEILVRGILSLPQKPAVVVVQTIGLEAPTMAVGGDQHMGVATYYG